MLNIRMDKSAEDVGLAGMLSDLMQQNVQQHPGRQADFDALCGSIFIEARDAEVSLTMEFSRGTLVVFGGLHGKPDVSISADSATILDLSNAKLFHGLPDLTHKSGQEMIQKLILGELKMKGMGLLLKPMLLIRFTKLLSVS
ncbi:MAG: SCP2 sterol-binding domain-containing protein [Myxococcota bacterium]|jgi:hypothetical protein